MGAVVAAAAIAGSLSLNRKVILKVPKRPGDEGEEVTLLPGLFTASLYPYADPPGTLPKPCIAGFVDMEWVTEDSTESEVQFRGAG